MRDLLIGCRVTVTSCLRWLLFVPNHLPDQSLEPTISLFLSEDSMWSLFETFGLFQFEISDLM